MKQRNRLLDRFVLDADLPGEVLPAQPLVEIAGECRILIENHRGVAQYGRSEICVKVRFGLLRICGCGLELARMTKQQLIITGRIDSVSLQRGKR